MAEMIESSLSELVRPAGFDCGCGRRHRAAIPYLSLRSGAVADLPEAMKRLGCGYPAVLCGPFGYDAAGKTVCAILENSASRYRLHVIPGEGGAELKPAERETGSALLNFDHACDCVIAVGSGVISDIGKVLSKTAKVPLLTVATAPSMDGYASDSASMEIGGIKFSLPEQCPSAILCDTDILKRAPMHMLHAGLGDILAKVTALCDWRISHIVTGEYYCPTVAALVEKSLKKTVAAAEGVKERRGDAVEAITEGLLLSGLGITFTGCSHPASGLEHYFSHCWDMMCLERGTDCELHGIQVAVGMLLTLKVVGLLRQTRPTMERAVAAADRFDAEEWERRIRRVFPRAADGILEMERKARKNDREARLRRAERAIGHWEEILEVFASLPDRAETEAWMRSLGMPAGVREIGLTQEDAADAFVCSRDIRDKYLISSLVWDLGFMDEFAQRLREETC